MADELRLVTTVAPVVATTVSSSSDTGASSGSSADNLPMFAAAGGGGVVLIVIIIVIVVVVSRRKRQVKPQGAARSVVAFENPIYGAAKEDKPDHEGLYDEPAPRPSSMYGNPAFDEKSARENPLYDGDQPTYEDGNFDAVTQALHEHADKEPALNDGEEFVNTSQYGNPMDDGGYLDVQD